LKKTTLFTIAAVIVIAMTVFYTTQLSSMGGDKCNPEISFQCELNFIASCIGGELWGPSLDYSYCDAHTCIAVVYAFCIMDQEFEYLEQECVDSVNHECGGW